MPTPIRRHLRELQLDPTKTAKRMSSLRPALRAIAALALLNCAALAQSTTGTIEGRVFSAATSRALVDARVTIEGGKLETLTDQFGAYHLTGVPAGETRVSVTYVGFEPQQATIAVAAGGATTRDFDLALPGTARRSKVDEVVQLGAFTVVADSEMSAQALAQNERKNAANIRQVVAFDEFGDRGAEDIGELMRFLPGVGIVDGGQTASSVALRGFPDNNTAMQIDGAEMASARGNSRTQSLLDVPMANISRVEVNKVPVPDQPASGIGG